jgi:branched-subunit amino acid aminotransferase/4-amino-4-deoxychorismate lyase
LMKRRRVRLFSAPHAASKKAGSQEELAHRPQRSLPTKNENKILTKQKFVAEPDIENKGTQNSLFFVNAQRETSFQRDDSVDWFAFNSRGWISEGRFSSFSQCA